MVNKMLNKVMEQLSRIQSYIAGQQVKKLLDEESEVFDSQDIVTVVNEIIVEELEGWETDDISDGAHTFGELYADRTFLFAMLVNGRPDICFKSIRHDDGSMYDGYFIVGMYTPNGYYTYHCLLDDWDLFKCNAVRRAPRWDGHTRKNIDRLEGYPWASWELIGGIK